MATLIGDPSRSAMLDALLSGDALPAGKLARPAGVSASTASEHLARVVADGLVARAIAFNGSNSGIGNNIIGTLTVTGNQLRDATLR